MGKGAQVVIDIVTAGVQGAVADMAKTSGAITDVGKSADGASSRMSKVHEGIGSTGDTAAMATTGLRDLGGAMQTMGGTAGSVGTAMVSMSTAFEAMDGAATLYAAAQSAASGAATVFNGVMKALRVTLLTNPIFLIAAVIIGIAVALVIAYKKSETFRNIVQSAFKGVLAVIRAVWSWIKGNWPLLLAILIGPIGLAVAWIIRNWSTVKASVSSVVSFIRQVWGVLTGILTAPFRIAWSVISGIFSSIRSAIQGVIDLIGRIKIPHIDLNPFTSSAAVAAPGVARAAPATPAARAGGGGVTINVTGALDPEGVARQIRRILDSSDRRGGRLGTLRPVGTV